MLLSRCYFVVLKYGIILGRLGLRFPDKGLRFPDKGLRFPDNIYWWWEKTLTDFGIDGSNKVNYSLILVLATGE